MLKNQSKTSQAAWNSTLKTFVAVARTFNYLVTNVQRYRSVARAIYIGFVNINISNPMFNGTFFDDVNLDNLKAKQIIVTQFVNHTNANWKTVSKTFRARVVFYEATNKEYNKTRRLNDMFNTLVSTLTIGAPSDPVRSWTRLNKCNACSAVQRQPTWGVGGAGVDAATRCTFF